jgi:hypothetical protein
MSYSKLHSSVVSSSLWSQPDPVRLLFVTLLALADQDGVVYGSKSGLSRIAVIKPEDVDRAWEILQSPDPESCDIERAPENEGRRIEKVSGGYRLLNFTYYRNLRNDDERRASNRVAQERFRAKSKPPSSPVITSHPPSPLSAQAEAEAEAEAETKTGPVATLPPSAGASAAAFEDFWQAYPRKVGKADARRWWTKHKPTPATVEAMGRTLAWQTQSEQWLREGGQFIPHPATWLNQGRWDDEPPVVNRAISDTLRHSIASGQVALDIITELDARRAARKDA